MTETKIFEILLQKHHDFPKLHSEAAFAVANSFADIIYDTVQVKSTLATTRRLDLLKFLRSLTPNCHVGVDGENCDVFINACLESDPIEDFQRSDLCSEIKEFNKRRNEKHRENVKRLELIQKHDQEALDRVDFPARVVRNISYYETSDKIITSLIKTAPQSPQDTVDITSLKYRRKQIKFAYALLHLRKWDPLNKILHRLHGYDSLALQETHFLEYLNENLPPEGEHLRQTLIKLFFFIYEKPLVAACVEIIRDGVPPQVTEKLSLIKELCREPQFKFRVQHLLLQLYVYSFCNRETLNFVDFLINKE